MARPVHCPRRHIFDPSVFRPSVYCEHWGVDRMLNGDAHLLTMRDFAHFAATNPATLWFVKPDDDLKRFTGGVMTHAEYCAWYTDIERLEGEGDIGPGTVVLVCELKTFGHEWRLFFVGGKIAARSCYTNDGRDLPLPAEVERFARDAVAAWSPADAFALDVTIDSNRRPRIIEANCINGSGFYLADAKTLVRSLSAFQESHWFAQTSHRPSS